jgi:Zn-dependent protease
LSFIALFVITPFVLLFGSVLAHEFGHIFAARYFGLRVGETILTPIGGMVMVGRSRTPRGEFVVAAGGPMVNVALALAGLVLLAALGGPVSLGTVLPFVGDDPFARLFAQGHVGLLVLHDFVQTNAILFFFNVAMIAYPMDGGRMLFAGLWHTKGYRPGMVVACKVSRVVAVLMGIGAIFLLSPMLGVIAFFVWFQATMMLRRAHLLDDPGLGYSGGREQELLERRRQIKKELRDLRPGPIAAWFEQRRTRRYVELLTKAETHGINSLTRSERDFLKRARERRK